VTPLISNQTTHVQQTNSSALNDDARVANHQVRILQTRGRSNRCESLLSGLKVLDTRAEFVAVNDAARPLVSQALISRVFHAAIDHGASGPAVPVALTIKQIEAPLPTPVVKTIARHTLVAMQTPQVAKLYDLAEAIRRCPIPFEQVTDDLQLLELIGIGAMLVAGEESNLKITTPLDLQIAKSILNDRRRL